MADAAYEAVVKETFQKTPLRTVLMVDDEFPTFADLARGETEETAKRFSQQPRAVQLYEAFQRSHMLCDIENVANDVMPERMRKSDLVVLDYHLGPGLNSSDRAIEILRGLSASKHFNTVAVYTAEPDLNNVWLEVIAGISGSWTALPGELTGDDKNHWDRLSDEGELPDISKEAIMAYARCRQVRDLPPTVLESARRDLLGLGVPHANCNPIIEALIHREMRKRAGKYESEPHRVTVGGYDSGNRWIQSGSVFITIVQKAELTDDPMDPAGILAALSNALLAWKPNLIQIVVSEIQNILELEALASEDELLRDPVTHTALWYYLLETLGPIDPQALPDTRAAVMSVIDKIVDGLRRRLSSDTDLLSLTDRALIGELKESGWTKEAWPKGKHLLDGAVSLARTKGRVINPDVLFRLNSFSSTERFSRAHITTGTVFRHVLSDRYFIAASPACDLVARVPSSDQWWSNSIHPLTPLVAVMLNSVSSDQALNEATQGNHIFLEIGKDKKALKAVAGPGHHPPFEFLILKNEGRVREKDGRTVFDATRLLRKQTEAAGIEEASISDPEWVDGEFEVVAQLRSVYATHILQLTGQHLSRIGLDFTSMPKTNG